MSFEINRLKYHLDLIISSIVLSLKSIKIDLILRLM